MIRRVAAVLLAMTLAGCAGAQSQPAAESPTAQEAVEETAQESGTGRTKSDEAGGSQASDTGSTGAASETAAAEEEYVTVVIPTVYENVSTQEEADEICEKNGYKSALLLGDGSLEITMTRDQQAAMIADLETSIDKGIGEILESGNYPAVSKIEYNKDYSIFTVTVSDEIGIVERQLAEELIMYGTFYHICSGNDVESIRVDYVDAETGEVVESADSGDLSSAY